MSSLAAQPVSDSTTAREDVGAPLDVDERHMLHDGPQVVGLVAATGRRAHRGAPCMPSMSA
jgi:hypothetical protein